MRSISAYCRSWLHLRPLLSLAVHFRPCALVPSSFIVKKEGVPESCTPWSWLHRLPPYQFFTLVTFTTTVAWVDSFTVFWLLQDLTVVVQFAPLSFVLRLSSNQLVRDLKPTVFVVFEVWIASLPSFNFRPSVTATDATLVKFGWLSDSDSNCVQWGV